MASEVLRFELGVAPPCNADVREGWEPSLSNRTENIRARRTEKADRENGKKMCVKETVKQRKNGGKARDEKNFR